MGNSPDQGVSILALDWYYIPVRVLRKIKVEHRQNRDDGGPNSGICCMPAHTNTA